MDDARTALAFADHLAIQLRADFPLIVVDTMEEQRVVARAAEVCRTLHVRCLTWDVMTGFTSVTEGRPMAPATDAIDVLSRLPLAPGAEVTIEANPGTLDPELLDFLWRHVTHRTAHRDTWRTTSLWSTRTSHDARRGDERLQADWLFARGW